jgi:hypothetical protein
VFVIDWRSKMTYATWFVIVLILLCSCAGKSNDDATKFDTVAALKKVLSDQEREIDSLGAQVEIEKNAHQSTDTIPIVPLPDSNKAISSENIQTITERQLSGAYQSNEIRADSKYTGKLVQVTGMVQKIGVDIGGNGYVEFVDDVTCYFKGKPASLVNLPTGDIATIRGMCKGKGGFMGLISLSDCIIEPIDLTPLREE